MNSEYYANLCYNIVICGLVIDRDENAAINILALGLQSLGAIPRSHPVHGVE